MSVTIQINSLEALERLIGNDNELEIQLRNSVAQDFATRHLKALVNDTLLTKAVEIVKKDIVDEFVKSYKKQGYFSKIPVFEQSIIEEFKSELRLSAYQSFQDAVGDLLKIEEAKQTVQDRINRAVDSISEQIEKAILERRIEKMVDARIKEKLGIA